MTAIDKSAFFDDWRKQLAFFTVTLLPYVFSHFLESIAFAGCSLLLYLFGMVILFLLLLYHMYNGRLGKTLFAVLVLLCCGIFLAFRVFLLVASFGEAILGADRWADNLTVPSGIQIDTPWENDVAISTAKNIFEQTVTQPELKLQYDFQPGLYKYKFWIGRIEKGSIYLKAYEVTQNTPLSQSSLEKASIMDIENPTDSLTAYSHDASFTIYEGDWGKYYAARFEVWFRPASGTSERMLVKKNFLIEGWMR